MSQFVLDLPEEVIAELKDRHIPDEKLQYFLVEVVKAWLRMEPGALSTVAGTSNGGRSRFSESAVPFVDRLIAENRALFERLARLPDEQL